MPIGTPNQYARQFVNANAEMLRQGANMARGIMGHFSPTRAAAQQRPTPAPPLPGRASFGGGMQLPPQGLPPGVSPGTQATVNSLPASTQGLLGTLAEMRGITNQMRTQPGAAGRAAGIPMSPPTAPGNYAQGLITARQRNTPGMGLLDNANAQRYAAESGYMPNTTVGGNYGLMPSNDMGTTRQQVVAPGNGRSMLTGPAAERQMAQTALARGVTQQGIAQQAAARAAQEAQFAADMQAGNQRADAVGARMERQGRIYYDPRNNRVMGAGSSGNDPGFDVDASGRGIGLLNAPQRTLTPEQLAANAEATQNRRGMSRLERRASVVANAKEQSAAREGRIAQRNVPPNALGILAARNPAVALKVLELQQQGRFQEAELEMRRAGLDLQGRKIDADIAQGQGLLDIEGKKVGVAEQEANNRGVQYRNTEKRLTAQEEREVARTNAEIEQAAQQADADGNSEGAANLRATKVPVQGGQGIVEATAPKVPASRAELAQQFDSELAAAKPSERATMLRRKYPNMPQASIDKIIAEITGQPGASEQYPEGPYWLRGILGTENLYRAEDYLGGDYKGPRMWDGGPPVPVIPGIGGWQQRFGF